MKKKIVIETLKLKEMLNSVKNAVSKDERRPVFTGICFESTGKNLTMTTCDGYRLFTSSCKLIEGSNFTVISPVFNTPKDAEPSTIISIDKDKKFITFDFGNMRISYRTIEGDFIDYKYLLERESDFSIRFNPKLLKSALTNIDGVVEMYFKGDRDAVIIKEVENQNNQKYVLPVSKPTKEDVQS